MKNYPIYLEYVWLDGYKTANLRSKIKVILLQKKKVPLVDDLPIWNFDGSSTEQAPGSNSECLLNPVRLYKWHKPNHYIVMCEVLNPDGTPHASNTRHQMKKLHEETKKEMTKERFF